MNGLYKRFATHLNNGSVVCPKSSKIEDAVCHLTRSLRHRMLQRKSTQFGSSELMELYLVPEVMSRLIISDMFPSEFKSVNKADFRWMQENLELMNREFGGKKFSSLIREFPQVATLLVLDRWHESSLKGGSGLYLFDGNGEVWIRSFQNNGKKIVISHNTPVNPDGSSGLKADWYKKIKIAPYFETKSRLLAEEIAAGKKLLSEKIHPSVSLLKMGISNTIYTFIYPETTNVVENLWKNASYLDLHGSAYLRKQDGINEVFFNKYLNWSSESLHGLSSYPHRYISHGSMEAIKTTFCQIRVKHPSATLHVFEGEFEGAIFAAKACGLPLKKHPRPTSQFSLAGTFQKEDFFYLSQPSSIDGFIWPELARFIKFLEKKNFKIMVDFAFLGTTPNQLNVDLSSPAIHSVFVSLSKAFGTYYLRIGGAFTREENDLLYDNLWFKNMLSLSAGNKLLESFKPTELPARYESLRAASLNYVNHVGNLNLVAADTILLGSQSLSNKQYQKLPESVKTLVRTSGDRKFLRVCVSPLMAYFSNVFEGWL